MKKPVIVIPAYQPDNRLISLVLQITANPNQKVIIVDDGSTGNSKDIFKALENIENLHIEVLYHENNLGKGQALKTSFRCFLDKYAKDHIGVITVDADGQHCLDDINKISKKLEDHPYALILGSRSFYQKDIPLRSFLGNKITSLIFKLATGAKIHDTQTGLRGISTGFLNDLMDTSETGYDFELKMLIKAVKRDYEILEIPIETIYIDQNEGSHFNPLLDSIKIYSVFFRSD